MFWPVVLGFVLTTLAAIAVAEFDERRARRDTAARCNWRRVTDQRL